MEIVKKIQLKIVHFAVVKNRCMLHGHVFVLQHHEQLSLIPRCSGNLHQGLS